MLLVIAGAIAVFAISKSLYIYEIGASPASQEFQIFNNWDLANVIFAVASSYVTALTIVVAAITYTSSELAGKKQRENDAHNELNERYVAFLELTLNNADFGVQDFSLPFCTSIYSADQSRPDFLKYKKQVIIYEILNSLLERAFVVYRDQDSDFKRRQWNGWHSYTIEWFSRPDFTLIWSNHIQCYDYDQTFNSFMVDCKHNGALLAIQISSSIFDNPNATFSQSDISKIEAWRSAALSDANLKTSIKDLIGIFAGVRKDSFAFISNLKRILVI